VHLSEWTSQRLAFKSLLKLATISRIIFTSEKYSELLIRVSCVVSVVTSTIPAEREQLDVFTTVKEITGSLVIKTNDSNVVDLSFLRNLHTIHGRQLE